MLAGGSGRCQEALLAVQIVATGFAGLKFLQHGQSHLEEAYISVYGGYATRLLRLQLDIIQALDKQPARSQTERPSPRCTYPFRRPGGQAEP